MDSFALAGAALVVGIAIGWLLRRPGRASIQLPVAEEKQQVQVAAELDRLASERDRLVADRKEVEALRASVDRDRADVERRNAALNSGGGEAAGERREIERLKTDLARERQASAREREDLTGARHEFEIERQDLGRALEELVAEREALTRRREELEREGSELSLEREAVGRDRQALDAARQELSAERDTLAREREQFEQERRTREARRAGAPVEVGREQQARPRSRPRGEQTADLQAISASTVALPQTARKERDTTVLVCDVGSAGEGEIPANVLRCLTDLQTVLSGIISDEGGTIDRFAGDRLIALFIPKRRNADHAGRALDAAERIANNVSALSRRLQYDLRIGIGIHSGSLPVAEDGHVDSSAIGDAIDIASRLEALAARSDVSIVLTADVLEHADREEESFAIVGEAPLGAAQQMTRIFTPRISEGAVQLDLIDLGSLQA